MANLLEWRVLAAWNVLETAAWGAVVDLRVEHADVSVDLSLVEENNVAILEASVEVDRVVQVVRTAPDGLSGLVTMDQSVVGKIDELDGLVDATGQYDTVIMQRVYGNISY